MSRQRTAASKPHSNTEQNDECARRCIKESVLPSDGGYIVNGNCVCTVIEPSRIAPSLSRFSQTRKSSRQPPSSGQQTRPRTRKPAMEAWHPSSVQQARPRSRKPAMEAWHPSSVQQTRPPSRKQAREAWPASSVQQTRPLSRQWTPETDKLNEACARSCKYDSAISYDTGVYSPETLGCICSNFPNSSKQIHVKKTMNNRPQNDDAVCKKNCITKGNYSGYMLGKRCVCTANNDNTCSPLCQSFLGKNHGIPKTYVNGKAANSGCVCEIDLQNLRKLMRSMRDM
jgi:hypothetical protein